MASACPRAYSRGGFDGASLVTTIQIVALVGVGLVTIVLALGLFNLLRGGPPNLSQKLMRARILLQLIAIIIVMTALFFAGRP